MNPFNRFLIQLAFTLSFLFSRIFAHSLRDYPDSFLVFDSISQQSVKFLTFTTLLLLIPLFLKLISARLSFIFSGFSLQFFALCIFNLLLYCISTPLSSGIYVITAPFFFFIGILFWHNKILQDTTLSLIISLLFNSIISIFQNPVIPFHDQLFVQQLYYGRSAGLIGINQNGAFISILLSFIVFLLSTNFFNFDLPSQSLLLKFRRIYPLLLFFGVLSLFLTISRTSIVYFILVVAIKYFRPLSIFFLSRKSIFSFIMFLVLALSSCFILWNNFSYLFIRLFRIDDIIINSDNLRYAQLSTLLDSIFLDTSSNLFGVLPSSLYLNTVGDNMWLESILAYGLFYTTSLFCLYLFSFVKLRYLVSRSSLLKLPFLNRISVSLSYSCFGIVFLSCFYGGLQSIPISSTYFLLVGLVYAESRYTYNL